MIDGTINVAIDRELYYKAKKYIRKNRIRFPSFKNFVENLILEKIE